MFRSMRVLVLTVSLAVTATVPAAAQEPVVGAAQLNALCEANAPDDATLETCLDIVGTVLTVEGDETAATSCDQLVSAANELPLFSQAALYAGTKWNPVPFEGDKPNKKNRQKVANAMAGELRRLLVTTVADEASEDLYSVLWEVYGRLRLYGAGANGADKLVGELTLPLGFLLSTENPYCENANSAEDPGIHVLLGELRQFLLGG